MLPLRPGLYNWLVTLYDDDLQEVDSWNCLPEMSVTADNHQSPYDQWSGVLNIPDQSEIISDTVAEARANVTNSES